MVMIKRRPQLGDAQGEPCSRPASRGPCPRPGPGIPVPEPPRRVPVPAVTSLLLSPPWEVYSPQNDFSSPAPLPLAPGPPCPHYLRELTPPDFRGTGFVHLLSVKTGKKNPPTTNPASGHESARVAPRSPRGPGPPHAARGGARPSCPPGPAALLPAPSPAGSRFRFAPAPLSPARARPWAPSQPLGLSPGPAAPSSGVWGKGSPWGGPDPSSPIDAGESPARPSPGPRVESARSFRLPRAGGLDDRNLRPPASREATWEASGIFPSQEKEKKCSTWGTAGARTGTGSDPIPGPVLVLFPFLFLVLFLVLVLVL